MIADPQSASDREEYAELFKWVILYSVLSFHELHSLVCTADHLKRNDLKPGEDFLEAFCLSRYERKDGGDDHSIQEPYRTDGAKSN